MRSGRNKIYARLSFKHHWTPLSKTLSTGKSRPALPKKVGHIYVNVFLRRRGEESTPFVSLLLAVDLTFDRTTQELQLLDGTERYFPGEGSLFCR